MTTLILIIIIATIALISQITKNSKAFDYIIIILIGFLIIFNRDNHDYAGYLEVFDYPESYAEPGYVILVNFLKLIGIGHEGVLFLLGILVIVTFIRYSSYSKSIGIALLCYTIFPLVDDIIQIRNTIVMFLLLNAILDYSEKKYFRGYILLLIAPSFHFLGFVYIIPYIMLFFLEKKYYFKVIAISVLCSILFSFLFGISDILQSLEIRNAVGYIAERVKTDTLITWGIIVLLDLAVFGFFIKNSKKIDKKNARAINVIYGFMMASTMLLGILIHLDHSSRIFRTFFVIKYLLAAIIIQYLSRNYKIIFSTYILLVSVPIGLRESILLDSDYVFFSNLLFE